MAKRKPLVRDLTQAITLRPREVFQLYGIHPSTLCRIVNSDDPEIRLESSLIPGRKGRKGVRLIDHAELRAYIAARRVDVAA